VWLQGWENSVSKTTRVSCTTSTRCAHRWTTTQYASANRATTSLPFPGLPTPGAVFAPKVRVLFIYIIIYYYIHNTYKFISYGHNMIYLIIIWKSNTKHDLCSDTSVYIYIIYYNLLYYVPRASTHLNAVQDVSQ